MKNRNTGIILSYANVIATTICGLFFSSFLLRRLGDTEYGLYQTMTSFANYLVLLEFGAGTVMTRNITACRAKGGSKEDIEKNISTVWSLTGILTLLLLGVSVGLYFLTDWLYADTLSASQIAHGKNLFVLITVYLLASFYSQTISGVTLAFEEYSFQPLLSLLRLAFRLVLLVFLLFQTNNAIAVVMVDAILGIMTAVAGFLYCRRKLSVRFSFRYFDAKIFKASLPFCLAIFLQGIVNQANSNVGKFILGIKVGPEEVALFSVGLYIYSVFSSITTIPISLYQPQIVQEVAAGKTGKTLTKCLIQPSRLIAFLGGTVLFGFAAVGRQFIDVVYGEEYKIAWEIALILMIPMFINMTSGPIINVLDAINKRLIRSVVLVIMAMANIVVTIYLIDCFGMVGSAVATSLCMLVGQIIILNIYYSRCIGIKVLYLYREAYRGILIFQILGAIAGYVIGRCFESAFSSMLAGGIVYIVIAWGGYFLFGQTKQEKERFQIFPLTKKHRKDHT